MTMPLKTLNTPTFFILALLLLPFCHVLFAAEEVVTDDGRNVQLNEDGTWSFRSSDRYANTKDGRRVKLKEDGSWEYVGKAVAPTPVTTPKPLLDIKLEKVVLEKYEKKINKNIRLRTQTVFYVDLDLSSQAQSNINISQDDISHIEVNDNAGTSYSVLSIQPSPATIKPGSSTNVSIRVEGSPKWLSSAKSMELILKPGIFSLKESITLTQRIDDFISKKVSGFDE